MSTYSIGWNSCVSNWRSYKGQGHKKENYMAMLDANSKKDLRSQEN